MNLGLSRIYDRARDPQSFVVAREQPTASGFDALRGHKYALLVSFRRSGEPVPTPVWFGLDADGRLYVRTEHESGKVKRVRANGRVLVGPANARGRPLGPLAPGSARVLPADEESGAEGALARSYGLGRRLYEAVLGRGAADYLEVTPA